MVIIKALFWLGIIIIGFFILMLIIYIAARIKMSGYIDEVNRLYENSLKQSKTEENDKEETK